MPRAALQPLPTSPYITCAHGSSIPMEMIIKKSDTWKNLNLWIFFQATALPSQILVQIVELWSPLPKRKLISMCFRDRRCLYRLGDTLDCILSWLKPRKKMSRASWSKNNKRAWKSENYKEKWGGTASQPH